MSVTGAAASPGVVVGPAFVVTRPEIVIADTDDPKGAFTAATESVAADLKELEATARSAGREEAAAVLGAQALMAEDPMLGEGVTESIDAGKGLQQAVEEAAGNLSGMLAAMEDEYLAARSADVLEVADRVLLRLAGVEDTALADLAEASVVVAESLTAAQTAQMDASLVMAFVTEQGGPTGHVAVIARSLGIPAVVGTPDIVSLASESGTPVAVDGGSGEVVVDPDAATVADFTARAARRAEELEAAAAFRGAQVAYGDEAFAVAANIGSPEDIERAVAEGADGVGLFRTEFLFLDRPNPPTEDEQYEVYAAAAAAFGHTVVVRTFDIGGDKPAQYLDADDEENPFLGVRGVRTYEDSAELFRSQIRALLRASTAGELAVMIPMVATVEDFAAVRATIDAIRAELEAEGAEIGQPQVGVMIEVPSAALVADRLAETADFFSIGTNDLTQYTLAADRTNPNVAGYSDPAHPAVLRLCAETAAAGRRKGVPTSVCGEAAADTAMAQLFAAMGITKLSVAAPSVNLVKAAVASADASGLSTTLEAALAAPDAATVRELMR